MSRNFHLLHVYAPTSRALDSAAGAVLAYAKRAGYERIARRAGADRIIRIGRGAGWLTIEDDGHEITAIADAITGKVRGPLLEAYCEASAIVWLALIAEGKRRGGWGTGRRPPARFVEPILVKGTPRELATAWEHASRQIFPETALAVAAQHIGMPVARMLGDTHLRGTTLALRRKRGRWIPRYHAGAPGFEVGWGSNQGWGRRHLLFDGELAAHNLQIRSTGGPGRGFTVRFGGSAIDRGLVEITDVQQAAMSFVRDGDAWTDPTARIPAGLVDEPDPFSLARAEHEKLRKITDAATRPLDVRYRVHGEGEGTLTAVAESAGGRGEDALDLIVVRRPWRPRSAGSHIDEHRLFALHRREHVYANITLRGSLAEAWAWARPHAEAWASSHGDPSLRVLREHEVVLRDHPDQDAAPSWSAVAEHFPAAAIPFQAAGGTFLFGTFAFAPERIDPGDSLVVQLVLGARCDDESAQLARLAEIADEAIARDLASSALVGTYRYMPEEKTPWEGIAVIDDDPLKLARWHEAHIRGLDKRIWMAAEHAARVDRASIAQRYTLAEVGRGLRITMADDRPRRDLEPLEELIGDLLPTQQTIEAWRTRSAQDR